jgi:hypothetical protein
LPSYLDKKNICVSAVNTWVKRGWFQSRARGFVGLDGRSCPFNTVGTEVVQQDPRLTCVTPLEFHIQIPICLVIFGDG